MRYTGDYFGYPRCCQKSFIETIRDERYPTLIQKYAGNATGFIPCIDHAIAVVNGEIALDDLIKNRVCPTPFPHAQGDKPFFEFCRTLKEEP